LSYPIIDADADADVDAERFEGGQMPCRLASDAFDRGSKNIYAKTIYTC
jgi:hypothetical protein